MLWTLWPECTSSDNSSSQFRGSEIVPTLYFIFFFRGAPRIHGKEGSHEMLRVSKFTLITHHGGCGFSCDLTVLHFESYFL